MRKPHIFRTRICSWCWTKIHWWHRSEYSYHRQCYINQRRYFYDSEKRSRTQRT